MSNQSRNRDTKTAHLLVQTPSPRHGMSLAWGGLGVAPKQFWAGCLYLAQYDWVIWMLARWEGGAACREAHVHSSSSIATFHVGYGCTLECGHDMSTVHLPSRSCGTSTKSGASNAPRWLWGQETPSRRGPGTSCLLQARGHDPEARIRAMHVSHVCDPLVCSQSLIRLVSVSVCVCVSLFVGRSWAWSWSKHLRDCWVMLLDLQPIKCNESAKSKSHNNL